MNRLPADKPSNIVDACLRCNNFKDDRDSGCPCDKCRQAWDFFTPYLLPANGAIAGELLTR